MAVILLRHTTPDVAPGTCYGRSDLDVAASFLVEAECVLARLPPVGAIVTSPLIRCQKLATFLGARLALGVETDARLMEMDFGTWEGCAWSAVPSQEMNAWAEDFFFARPHGGESVAMLHARACAALADWSESEAATLLVTHAGVIRAALADGQTANQFNARIGFGQYIALPAAHGVSK